MSLKAPELSPLPDLPTLYEGTLDDASLSAFVADVGALDGGVAVQVKRHASRTIDADEQPSLAAAMDGLRSGKLRAVQLRYVHAGEHWLDTLFRAPQGFRIVRLREAQVP